MFVLINLRRKRARLCFPVFLIINLYFLLYYRIWTLQLLSSNSDTFLFEISYTYIYVILFLTQLIGKHLQRH